uniref:Ring finger and CHY zinc finger domain containing 1 n=1 Tax=Eptatretus burgeri TaxID=7764 RepID=A0A8C4QUP4_EPTBU
MAGIVKEDGSCIHYKRHCKLLAKCCGEFFVCRLCHDDVKQHTMDRFSVTTVKCIQCGTEQPAAKVCKDCGMVFGEYYCSICHLFDADNKQYHCSDCGICRVGPKEYYFHCFTCNLCLANDIKDTHKCVQNVSRQNCPVCMEDLHTSRISGIPLPCGHLLHRTCFKDTLKSGFYRCPLCVRSMVSMRDFWKELDDEIAMTPMPEEYQSTTIMIFCNDCLEKGSVPFHVLGMKCSSCGSYNTTQDGGLSRSPQHPC